MRSNASNMYHQQNSWYNTVPQSVHTTEHDHSSGGFPDVNNFMSSGFFDRSFYQGYPEYSSTVFPQDNSQWCQPVPGDFAQFSMNPQPSQNGSLEPASSQGSAFSQLLSIPISRESSSIPSPPHYTAASGPSPSAHNPREFKTPAPLKDPKDHTLPLYVPDPRIMTPSPCRHGNSVTSSDMSLLSTIRASKRKNSSSNPTSLLDYESEAGVRVNLSRIFDQMSICDSG